MVVSFSYAPYPIDWSALLRKNINHKHGGIMSIQDKRWILYNILSLLEKYEFFETIGEERTYEFLTEIMGLSSELDSLITEIICDIAKRPWNKL